MPKQSAPPPPFPAEFRRRLIELARAGQSPEELARKFEPSAQTIRKWVRQADLDQARSPDGLTTEGRAELLSLRRENRTLRRWYTKQWPRRRTSPPTTSCLIAPVGGRARCRGFTVPKQKGLPSLLRASDYRERSNGILNA